jgi:hypothetical protein
MLSYCIITTVSLKLLEHEIALFRYIGAAPSVALQIFEVFNWLNHLIYLMESTFDLVSGVFSLPLKQARLWADRLNFI